MKKRKLMFQIIGIVLISISLIGCRTESEKKVLTIMAAASLSEAYTDLEAGFEAEYPNIDLEFNFAGSGTLVTQIKEGLDADVFVSASETSMDALISENYIMAEDVKIFAHNQLALMVNKECKVEISSMEDIINKDVQIVIAEPSQPIGKYTEQMLDNIESKGLFRKLYIEQFYDHVVSKENSVKAVAVKVEMGEADAGIVYITDFTSTNKDKVYRVDIPKDCNPVTTYELGILKNSQNKEIANQFVDYVLNKEGQEYLLKYGFLLP